MSILVCYLVFLFDHRKLNCIRFPLVSGFSSPRTRAFPVLHHFISGILLFLCPGTTVMAPPTSAERTSEDSSSPTQPFLEQRIPFREEFLRPPRSSLSWFIHILAFCVSLTLGLVALTMKPSSLQCTHQLSPYCMLTHHTYPAHYTPK